MNIMLLLLTSLHAPTVPLLDGQCGEYDALDAREVEMSEQITLQVFQDASYVWLCYALPDDSYGTLDLTLRTTTLESPVNLHVSAQLGEWPANDPDLAPQTADSDLWWQVDGWWSNAVSFNGTDDAQDPPGLNFRPSAGRELQLSKARFGKGMWNARFEIRAIRLPDGTRTSLTYPADRESWLEINVN